MITDFLATNPQINLQTADLFSANALAQYNWPEDVNQRELLQSLRTRQRLLKINPDDEVAAVLESLGFHSAHHIAATGKSAFIQKVMPALAQLSDIEHPRAFCTQLFGNAERIRRASFELALGVPQMAAAKVAEPFGEEINAIFEQGVPDYQRLFGPMFTCDCKDCQSIFGPAAYFTDLMRVVSQYVSPPPETLFSLRYRRPDLWTVPLDCRSSDSEVAYLDIVNEVICQHLKVNYLHDADPIQQMAARVYPFSTPFNSSLYTIRGGLEALGTSFSSIYRLLDVPALATSAEALNLSPEQLSLVTGSYQVSLARLYGFDDETLSDEDVCDTLSDQKVFLQKTGLSPDQLEGLIYQQLKKGSGSYAMQDRGSQDAKTVAFSDAVLAGSITIECWVYPTSTYTNMSIIGKGMGEEFYFYLANKKIRCKYGDADGFSSEAELNLHAWTHIAWTRNGNENTIYINGVPDSTHPVSGTIQVNNSAIGIGYISGASSFHGGITELRIWSEARSADLIRKMMYLRLQNYTDVHLFAYWPLNEQTGKTAYDFGPHHYDATGGYETAFYETAPIGSVSELNPTILHGLFLNNLLPSGQFIGIARPAVSQDNPLLNLFASPELVGLSDQALRQMAVYIRLQAQTGWSFGELDWLLKTLVNSLGIPTQSTINDAMIESLGQVAELVKKYKIPIDELSSFWWEMKTYGRGNDTDSEALWDRVFNRPPLMANSTDPDQPTYYRPTYTLNPLFTSPVINWAYRDSVGSQDDRLANQLAAALKISIQDLYTIIQSTIKTGDTQRSVTLEVTLLSQFYRVARFAQMLDLSVPDFIQLSLIAGSAVNDTKFTWKISEVIRLTEIAEWMKAARLDVKQLSYLTSAAAPDLSLQLLDVSAINKALAYMRQSSKQVLLSAGSFVNDRIDAATAQAIYDQLLDSEIIDSKGLVLMDESILTPDFVFRSLNSNPGTIDRIFPASGERSCVHFSTAQSGKASFYFDPFANETVQDTNCFTISAWIKPDTNGSSKSQKIIGRNEGASNNTQWSPTITQLDKGQLQICMSLENKFYDNIVEDYFVNPSEWVYISWVNDKGNWQVFRNGIQVPFISPMDPVPGVYQTGTSPIYVFANGFNGYMCNVSIWTTARTVMEIRSDMVRSDYNRQRDLLAWWPINEGADTIINDYSENGEAVNGTLSGSYTWTLTAEIAARMESYKVAQILSDAFTAQNHLVVKAIASLAAVSVDTMAGVCFLTSREVNNASIFSSPSTEPYPYFVNLLLNTDSQAPDILNNYLSVLQRNTALARWLKLTGQEVSAILSYSQLIGGQSISYGTQFLSLQQLMTLTDYKSLQNSCNKINGLLDYFRAAAEEGTNTPSANQLNLLSQLTGWNLIELESIVNQPYYGDVNFNTVAGLCKLANVMKTELKIGTDISTLNLLRGLSVQNLLVGTNDQYWQQYTDSAVTTFAMLEGKLGASAVETLKIRDATQLRTVLCDWLIWELQRGINKLKNQQDLYEYLLIDVSMSPDVKISWMVTAMNSLQLYVNRIINNLEPGTENKIPEIWWEWMSNYRVWQANREIYLYPENYVDPALRKFQSPAFKTFISDVSKGQITDENVKQSLTNYLETINEVACLELVDGYVAAFSLALAGELEHNEKKAIHLIGRSRKKPFVFYSRTALAVTSAAALDRKAPFEDATYMHFGPWQEINLQINADYVSTVVAFGRQFIFWVEQTEIIDTDNDSNKYTSVYAAIYYSYRNFSGKWEAPISFVKDILVDVFGPAIGIDTIDYYEDYFVGARLGNSQTEDKFYKARNWKEVKVQVLPPTDTEGEKILVTYGPLVCCPSSMEKNPPKADTSKMIPAAADYQNMLHLAAKRAYIRRGNATTVLEVHTLNNTMEVDSWKLSINQSNVFFIDYATLPLDDETGLVFFADTLGNDAEIDNPYKVPDAFWPMLMNMNLVEGTTIKSLYTDAPGTFSKSPTVLTGTNSLYNTLKPVSFDGELFASIPWNKYQSLTKFTVSCWVYLQNSSANQCFLSLIFLSGNSSSSHCGWDISVEKGTFKLGIGIPNGINSQIKQGPAENNKWHFVALTVNSETNIVITVNDSSSAPNAVPYSPVSSSPQNLTVGKSNRESHSYSAFVGSVVNLKVWKNPLSTQELLDEYKSSGMAPSQEQMLRLGNSAAGFIYNVRKQSYLALPCFESALLSESLIPDYSISNRHLDVYFSQSPVNEYQEAKMKLIPINTDTLPALIHLLAKEGVNALLRPAMQYLLEEKPPVVAGANLLLPETNLMNFSGAFGAYFWEIFFYAPYYVAEKLRTANKYPAAEKWYQYIFDPTNQATPVAYWPLNRTFNDQFPNLTGREAAISNGSTAPSEETPFFSNKPRKIWKLAPKNKSYFSVPYAKALNSPEFTVAAWINLASVPANNKAYSVVCSQSENKGFHLAIWGKGNKQWSLMLTIGTSGSEWINAISSLYVGTGQWIYVTGTYDGKSLQVFINGIAAIVEEAICENYIANTAGPLTIGNGNSVDANSNFFDGSIAEVTLFDHALSQGELLQIYQDYPQLSLNSNFWNFRPFRRINAQSLYHILNGDAWQESFFQPAQYYTASLQMAVYEYDPFDPDTLARLRVNSWQKAAFMRYMDNLISWGDSLFTQNTWETISDATMRYTLATTLLGRLPVKEVTEETKPTVNYNSMELEYGEGKVPPFLIEVENQLSGLGADATLPEQIQSIVDAYYCIPSNKQLLKYWELVADRLYKIRHGLSISGAPNAIPLYASPINPAAAASLAVKGGTINTIASSTSPVVPWYRFNYMMAQARSVTTEVTRLGSELLVALEKKDAEKLSQLQAGYQLVLNNLSGQIKASQINQLEYLGEGLQANLDNAKYVQDTYKRWLKTSINFEEAVALDQLANAEILQEVGVALKGAATISLLLPNIFGLANGGFNPGESFNASASVFDTGAQIAQTRSQQTSQTAQFNRREEEWEMQLNISSNQIREIQAQIAANDFALEAAQREMVLTATQWQQSQEVYQFLQTKFTNEELYDWMSGQLSTLYFQMFQLAWSLAQSAQTALQYELNLNQTYLNQTAWNAGYQGLLAGDALSLALQQMENAYISGNNRKLEIRKTWSMRQNNPQALLTLVSTGNCHFDLNELNYDLDFPGHYNRKIKSLSITIPAVVGPYQNIHATLTQMGNTVILKPNIAAVEYLLGLADKAAPTDGSLRINWNPNQEIIISSGINDAGVFQVNFNDEQYLPFEGTGAISSWSLRIPQASNAFFLRSISDVIITVEYTAEDGGSTYASKVTALAPLTDYKGCQYLSMRQLYSTAWFDFCEHPVDDVYALAFELLAQMYPANLDKGSVKLGNDEGEIGLVPVMQQGYTGDLPTFKMNNATKNWTAEDGMLPISDDNHLAPQPVPGKGNPWTLCAEGVPETLLTNGKIDQTKLLDIILLIPFSGKLSW